MAKILIWDTDPNSPDPKNAHNKGDIFIVQPDDFVFGTEEGPPKFKVIELNDDHVQLKKYVSRWANADFSIYRMSLWRYDEDTEEFVRKSDGLREKRVKKVKQIKKIK